MSDKTKLEEIKDYFKQWPSQTWDWRWRNLENLVDDPVDAVKEKLHGMKLPFGYELNISFMMKNRPTTWDIIRKQGDHSNDDPEDLTK